MATRTPQFRTTGKPEVDRRRTARKRKFDAVPDTIDFRDQMYTPSLIEVPAAMPLERYLEFNVPLLDQGTDGACTGYALATVVNYLLRQKGTHRGNESVSPQMLFDMARRYDEWPGDKTDFSSARGAMKGWHKHGVCTNTLWKPGLHPAVSQRIANDAATRPLGAYYRVNHKDLVSMHAALAEVGIILASAAVHAGWDPSRVKRDGLIEPETVAPDGHAFAIVGYDHRGFWIQNSWGKSWGRGGFGLLTYGDWLAHATDAWVARLGAPADVRISVRGSVARTAASRAQVLDFVDLRPHIISIGNDGQLKTTGQFGTTATDVETIIKTDFVAKSATWSRKRLLLWAHGGLVGEDSAIDTVRTRHKQFLDNEIYPIFFIWHSDYLSTLKDILQDAIGRRRSAETAAAGGVRDFLLDRIDDSLEPLARTLSGKAEWSEMKENAERASTTPAGGARIAAQLIAQLLAHDPSIEIHLAGHSAGAVFMAPLAQLLATSGAVTAGPLAGDIGLGLPVQTVTLLAPACTMRLFRDTYLPLAQNGRIGRFSVFTLDDKHEQDDDCARIYNKSLLYLVSNAFEDQPRIPLIHPDGEPLLGMEHFIRKEPDLAPLFANGNWILAPNHEPQGAPNASTATKHGGFGDDPATVDALIARIRGSAATVSAAAVPMNSDTLRERRNALLR